MNPKADKYSSMTRDERFIESWSFIWFRAWDKIFFKNLKKFIKKTESSVVVELSIFQKQQSKALCAQKFKYKKGYYSITILFFK